MTTQQHIQTHNNDVTAQPTLKKYLGGFIVPSVTFTLSKADVIAVMYDYKERIIKSNGDSIEDYVSELWGSLDHQKIQRLAVKNADDLTEAQQGAHEAIHAALVALDVIEF